MLIRREGPDDAAAVRAVVAAAFDRAPDPSTAAGGPRDAGEPPEAPLLDALRVDESWLGHLSLVAVGGAGDIVGHVVATRAWIGEVPALGLGPIAVVPQQQGTGVGSALMHAVVCAAEATGEHLIGLLGEPRFYGRFGFGPAVALGIEAPDPSWGDHFQARALTTPAPRGPFRYAAPFGV